MSKNIDIVIQQFKSRALDNRNEQHYWENRPNPNANTLEYAQKACKCAEENEQLASWLTELQERREADKWVNAKERKPEKDGVYLVVVEFQHILLVTYYDVENEHWGTANDVIAWRPLPEPYKESEATND